jgi:hypothetical protein
VSDFELTPEHDTAIGSKRAQGWHRNAAKRLAALHVRYGKGPVGQTCRDCVFLHRFGQGTKHWMKCEKATLDGHVGTDWRAKWAACGAFRREP